MKNLLIRLTSRKFLLALAAIITFYVNQQWSELMATVIAYVAAEGTADAARAYSDTKYIKPIAAQAEIARSMFDRDDDDDVDKDSEPVPGQL